MPRGQSGDERTVDADLPIGSIFGRGHHRCGADNCRACLCRNLSSSSEPPELTIELRSYFRPVPKRSIRGRVQGGVGPVQAVTGFCFLSGWEPLAQLCSVFRFACQRIALVFLSAHCARLSLSAIRRCSRMRRTSQTACIHMLTQPLLY